MYWTKRKVIFNEKENIYQALGDFEIINYSVSNAVPDGDGFEVDMNGIEFIDYIKRPDDYVIIKGKLYKKSDVEV